MELADGTLGRPAWRRPSAPASRECRGELLEYMAEAAKGLDFLNSPTHRVDDREGVSVQHRDIKPQNILIVGGGVGGRLRPGPLLEQTVVSHSGSLTPPYATLEFFQRPGHATSDQYSPAVTYASCGPRTAVRREHGVGDRGPSWPARPSCGCCRRRNGPSSPKPWPGPGPALAELPDVCRLLASLYHAFRPISTRRCGRRRQAAPVVGELRRYTGATEKVLSLAYSPDGRHVLTGTRTGRGNPLGRIEGKELRRFEGHEGVVRTVAFRPTPGSR